MKSFYAFIKNKLRPFTRKQGQKSEILLFHFHKYFKKERMRILGIFYTSKYLRQPKMLINKINIFVCKLTRGNYEKSP